MTTGEWEVVAIAAATAAACAVPGVFLVLRRMALLSDAISHVVLLGIVVAYLVTRDLASPLLFVGAAVSGVLAVALVEALQRFRRLKEDAAIGLVFPAMFAVAVILVARKTSNIHLDVDAVLLGELAFAPFQRWHGLPQSLAVMLGVVALNVGFVGLFYKELKLATFDAPLAGLLGLAPVAVHYLLMGTVSVTAVAAFDAVGSVLVVAFMIVPAATAYLLTDRLAAMLLLAVGVGVGGAVAGTLAALHYDTTLAGTIAATLGAVFAVALAVAPERGLAAQWLQHAARRRALDRQLLAVHLAGHEGGPDEEAESRLAELHEHLDWPPERVQRVVAAATALGWVRVDGERLRLTDEGRTEARAVFGPAAPAA